MISPSFSVLKCGLAGIIHRIIIFRGYNPIQYSGNDFRCIVLMGYQTVRKFPVEPAAAMAFEPADDINTAFPSFQQHDPLTGIPVRKRFTTDGTIGYDTASNKKYFFPHCK